MAQDGVREIVLEHYFAQPGVGMDEAVRPCRYQQMVLGWPRRGQDKVARPHFACRKRKTRSSGNAQVPLDIAVAQCVTGRRRDRAIAACASKCEGSKADTVKSGSFLASMEPERRPQQGDGFGRDPVAKRAHRADGYCVNRSLPGR